MVTGIRMQRSGVPLLVLAAILFVAAAVVVFLLYDPFDWIDGEKTTSDEMPQSVDADEPAVAAEPAATESVAAEPTTAAGEDVATRASSTHTIGRGDTLFDLAGQLWDNTYLWPVLLAANQTTVLDPDLLRPGQVIVVPERPAGTVDQNLIDAHVLAYHRYRDLGYETIRRSQQLGNSFILKIGRRQVNKSLWVLYSGLRFDPTLLDRYEADIDASDRRVIDSFVTRFGIPTDK